eukprot:TRINITY_DN7013_c0_g1_i5.p1 TRINITY_DN7013_c0_g1~~TRINITY_DN7013_c0_g1_i5.p1  ORF type:complete len:127 (+),score=10.27 TRINITY_DN7013_c0_g1_i5:53-433(+)
MLAVITLEIDTAEFGSYRGKICSTLLANPVSKLVAQACSAKSPLEYTRGLALVELHVHPCTKPHQHVFNGRHTCVLLLRRSCHSRCQSKLPFALPIASTVQANVAIAKQHASASQHEKQHSEHRCP